MEVILLERVAKLGQMGEVVRVKDGFARNFLLKRGKALRATADNRAKFDGMKAELEANNLKAKGEADQGRREDRRPQVVVIRQASETGQLFGSVTVRDIVAAFEADGVTVNRSQVCSMRRSRRSASTRSPIAVHPEVEVSVTRHRRAQRRRGRAHQARRGHLDPPGRPGRRRRSARRRRRILRSGSPARRGRAPAPAAEEK